MAMSRPWSECAATPPATWRAKWRAAIVDMSAPQMPVFSSASLPTRRHGPMRADAAAGAALADGAGLHVVGAAEGRLDAALVGVGQHLEGRRVDALGGGRQRRRRSSRRPWVISFCRRECRRAPLSDGGARARGAAAWLLVKDRREGHAPSVLAVVSRHGEVDGVRGGDAHAGGRPGRLVGGGGRRLARPPPAVPALARAGRRCFCGSVRAGSYVDVTLRSSALAATTVTASSCLRRSRTARTWWSAHMPGTAGPALPSTAPCQVS